MSQQSSTKIRVSKLVTLAANYGADYSSMLPLFTYCGSSRTIHTDVQVTFPSNNQNMMFYEHFKEDKDKCPFILAFMCLGKDDSGKISSNFEEYEKVEIAEFSKEIKSVNLVLQVVSQLPKCREVKIIFDDCNILLAAEDSQVVNNEFSVTSQTVKVLKVVRLKGNEDLKLDINNTKLPVLLKNAFQHLSELQSLYMDGMEGGGKTYDLVRTFCELKKLPKHNIRLWDGRVFCKPEVAMLPTIPCSTIIKQEPGLQSSNGSDTMSREIEFPRLPLNSSSVTTSNDDVGFSPPIQIKTERSVSQSEQSQMDVLACPPKTGMMPSPSNSLPLARPSNALTSLRSCYHNSWGASSDEEIEERIDLYSSSPPIPRFSGSSDDATIRDSPDGSEVAGLPIGIQISAEELKNMLDAVSSSEDTSGAVVVDDEEVQFIEGVHFQRRAKEASGAVAVDREGIEFIEGIHYQRRPKEYNRQMPN